MLPTEKVEDDFVNSIIPQEYQAAHALFSKSKRSFPALSRRQLELQKLLISPFSSMEEISALLKQEPLIMISLLSLANIEAKMNKVNPVKSLEQAVGYLGRSKLYSIILSSSMQRIKSECLDFTPAKHWGRALTAAQLTQYFAQQANLSQEGKDIAFSTALYSNVGRFISSLIHPSKIDAVYRKTQQISSPCKWETGEEELGIPNSKIFSEMALCLWGLPCEIIKAVEEANTLDAFQYSRAKKSTQVNILNFSFKAASEEDHRVVAVAGLATQCSYIAELNSHYVDRELLKNLAEDLGVSLKSITKSEELFIDLYRSIMSTLKGSTITQSNAAS
jgi:HD-like signal output (HDOD) protein